LQTKFTREGGVDYQMTDSEVQKVIKEKLMSLKVPLVFEKTYHKFGVTQPNIQKLGSGQILVELPGAKM
jgi:SecD/SecF fusion protein